MKKLEIFFDYFCPYCLKGHEQLVRFVKDSSIKDSSSKDNSALELIWHPCEIYKLPGNIYATKRTDNCIQGMYFAAESNADLWRYHQRVYDLIYAEKVNVEDIDTFTKSFEGFLDVEAFGCALKAGKYRNDVSEANHFAFQKTGVNVVPTYRADGGFLQDRQEFFNMGHSNTAYGGTK